LLLTIPITVNCSASQRAGKSNLLLVTRIVHLTNSPLQVIVPRRRWLIFVEIYKWKLIFVKTIDCYLKIEPKEILLGESPFNVLVETRILQFHLNFGHGYLLTVRIDTDYRCYQDGHWGWGLPGMAF
jgi:hypothetical protein